MTDSKDKDKNNYKNAETNPTKEIISQGREPTLNYAKVANGMDQVNVYIKKLESDYMQLARSKGGATAARGSVRDRDEENLIAKLTDVNHKLKSQNGILIVELKREVPESMKPKSIAIDYKK